MREAAIEEGATRLKSLYTQDPTVTWRKVVDTATGNIAGGATGNTYLTNPFAEAGHPSAYWFPNDSSRRYAEEAMAIYATARVQHVPKPHQCKLQQGRVE